MINSALAVYLLVLDGHYSNSLACWYGMLNQWVLV